MSDGDGVEHRLVKVESQISIHEAVCAERYQSILSTSSELKQGLKSVNTQIVSIGLLLLCGMAGILGQMVFFGE